MSIQYCDIPLVSPFKFYQNTSTPGEGFDADWAYNQIKSFETKVSYPQRWQIGDETAFQISSTIAPLDLQVYDCKGTIVKTIPWAAVLIDPSVTVYECIVNLDSISNQRYYFYFEATLLLTSFKWVSEPIEKRTLWPNTKVFSYYNSSNNFGVYFTGGYNPKFRCEAGIMEFNPGRERTSFIDEIHDVKTLSAIPYREFKLYIADEKGVAEWVIDLLNRIYCCDHVEINSFQYETTEGSKWNINRIKGYPLVGAEIDITESKNRYSNQQSAGSVNPGLVTGYTFSPFFGTSVTPVQIIEIETL